MDDKIIRQWYQLGQMMVLIDYEFRMPIAYVNARLKETLYTHWTPEQEATLHEFVAHVGGKEQGFSYNPHNREEVETSLSQAMDWCEDEVGQPYRRLNRWQFILRILMIWKYEPVWQNGRIVAVKPKGSNLTLNGRNK